ncbi:hypothetical protein MFRU_006g02820 [Monilinia fructicola]|nr:hypothetical protein MFRU_006g02820 [Monilinia fructicola]
MASAHLHPSLFCLGGAADAAWMDACITIVACARPGGIVRASNPRLLFAWGWISIPVHRPGPGALRCEEEAGVVEGMRGEEEGDHARQALGSYDGAARAGARCRVLGSIGSSASFSLRPSECMEASAGRYPIAAAIVPSFQTPG